jgi:hypothetical protein
MMTVKKKMWKKKRRTGFVNTSEINDIDRLRPVPLFICEIFLKLTVKFWKLENIFEIDREI